MADEERIKKLEAATGQPDEVEQALAKLQEDGTGEESGIPNPSQIEVPGPVIEPLAPNPEEMVSCQWYLGESNFCDKIKRNVHCSGDMKNCIVCK